MISLPNGSRHLRGFQVSFVDIILNLAVQIGLKTRIDRDIQIGNPSLADTETTTYYEIVKKWFQNCDHNHSGCSPTAQNYDFSQTAALPEMLAREISVGKEGDNKVYLLEAGREDQGQWISLSHQ